MMNALIETLHICQVKGVFNAPMVERFCVLFSVLVRQAVMNYKSSVLTSDYLIDTSREMQDSGDKFALFVRILLMQCF